MGPPSRPAVLVLVAVVKGRQKLGERGEEDGEFCRHIEGVLGKRTALGKGRCLLSLRGGMFQARGRR